MNQYFQADKRPDSGNQSPARPLVGTLFTTQEGDPN
jgi:hypothetical protein